MLCTTIWVPDYNVHHRCPLCTTNLHCGPWCTRGTYVREKWGLPPTFFVFWWGTRNMQKTDMQIKVHNVVLYFGSAQCSFVPILHVRYQIFFDGVQCSVVSLKILAIWLSIDQDYSLGKNIRLEIFFDILNCMHTFANVQSRMLLGWVPFWCT